MFLSLSRLRVSVKTCFFSVLEILTYAEKPLPVFMFDYNLDELLCFWECYFNDYYLRFS